MIRMGQKVRSIVSGFTGIVTGRVEYINGCVQYVVVPRVKEDGSTIDVQWIDEQNLEIVDEGITSYSGSSALRAGGPQQHVPSATYRG